MGAAEFLRALVERGADLSADGDRLVVDGAELLTDDDRSLVRQHRDALLSLLRPAVDAIPSGGRDILSLLDMAPMSTAELVDGLSWPHGAVVGLVYRLRSIGVIRQASGRWTLTGMAELHALAPRAVENQTDPQPVEVPHA